jgi:hypothetical protein
VAKIRATHPSQQLSADECAERIADANGLLSMSRFMGKWLATWKQPTTGAEAVGRAVTFTGALRALVRELERMTERRTG